MQDIEQGMGRIRTIAAQHPWLVQACQDIARQELGSEFSVFRALSIPENKPIRPETVVSTTLDWNIAWKIASNAPGVVFQGDNTMHGISHVLLHYRIRPENIVIWVDHALHFVKQAIGKRTNHRIEDRHGELIKIQKVLDFLEEAPEKEIIADVTGLTPKVLRCAANSSGGIKLWAFRDHALGHPSNSEWENEFEDFLSISR